MAKDDYFYIVFQLLTYLYETLKKGEDVEAERIDNERFDINKTYYDYIIKSLVKENYIEGVKVTKTNRGHLINGLKNTLITVKGIEYLQENNRMQKMKGIFKDIKDIVPFI